ncbi:hypothetical protein FNF31_01183 [Cafeteria roenbergensis]|uniref:Uncharacterized protein n=1 Tax=Cafeteria roenbergensis TaxID=33653 RepID=A0A5A8DNJ3_CAFRO|nr:hypothetical protein FNF31_01183 [Cafeteria roenbergensis]
MSSAGDARRIDAATAVRDTEPGASLQGLGGSAGRGEDWGMCAALCEAATMDDARAAAAAAADPAADADEDEDEDEEDWPAAERGGPDDGPAGVDAAWGATWCRPED